MKGATWMKGGCREGGRDRLYGSVTTPFLWRSGMNGRWTVQRTGSLARGRMKEGQSKSTQPRRNPVPSRPTRRPKDPRKLLRGGDPGGGGAVLLPLAKRVVLGGWAALISGRFHWQRNPGGTPRGASTPLQGPAVSANPCFEITRMLMIRAEEENGQTSKRANVPQASRIAIGEGSSRGKKCRP